MIARIAHFDRSPTIPSRLVAFGVGLLFVAMFAQWTLAVEWRVGPDFDRQLDSAASVVWADVPLIDALNSLANAHRICIFLDRRVDPNQRLTLEHSQGNLRELLIDCAAKFKLETGLIGPVVYLGPPISARMAATAAMHGNDQFKGIVKRAGLTAENEEGDADSTADGGTQDARATEKKPHVVWAHLSQPRQLLAEVCSRCNVQVKNMEVVPHDLWSAHDFPDLSPGEQLTLILIGFDLYFRVDPAERELHITRFPRSLLVQREYPSARDPDLLAKQLSETFPRALLQSQKQSIIVRGSWEDHRQIERLIRHGGRAPNDQPKAHTARPSAKNERFTLSIENQPLKPLIMVLAKRLEMEVDWTDVSDQQMQARVTFKVDGATRDELFQAAFAGTTLRAEMQEKRLVVHPAKPTP